ncbi:PREDICTED: SET domain-containing protein 9 isoform X2 [Hipposideros armiger]|uniref:SET domain-containing protein 9 isoform X2 n=1 Tax=Hipposideros armiger TaxID=186990 RepID=A0A8B7RX72_HIPAR|nr:PREDICTED: SET domain-containing protein 9 isoform X2 [Hipposideros armiger]
MEKEKVSKGTASSSTHLFSELESKMGKHGGHRRQEPGVLGTPSAALRAETEGGRAKAASAPPLAGAAPRPRPTSPASSSSRRHRTAMPGRLLWGLWQRWRRYRYRFVPWIALNLSHNPRTLRYVPEESKDKVISDEDVLGTLLKVFQALFINDFNKQSDILTMLPEPVKSKYQDLLSVQHPRVKLLEYRHHQQNILKPEEVLYKTLGFSIARATSSLMSAGKGVFVTKGLVPKGVVVSMYPGTVYQKYEPIFFQSIGNPFIFRCLDGVLIDGNDKGISKIVYRSCNGRDRLGPLKMSDSTWLTSEIQNPLAIGQYVNNCSNDRPANVCYQEFDVPAVFPIELKQYLPNIAYSYDKQR